MRSQIIGCGAFLPRNVLTNTDLAKRVDTNDEWIVARTGIHRRHIAAEGEKTSDLAFEAATDAMRHAGIGADALDLIVVATTTPDETFPAVATAIQARLGMTRGAAFDVQAVCSGFIFALSVADNFIRAGQAKTVLVIGAETMSRLMDWSDRTTCVLFGDGAGAVVLRAGEGKGGNADRGVLNTKLFSDGRLHDLLYVDGGPSTTGTTGYLRMQGREVFKHAVTNIAAAIQASADEAGIAISEIDWFVPHQANQRILDGTARKLGIDPAKVVSTVADHGNTSAASVPLALATAVADGRIKPGQLVLLEAMGGGLTWGSALIRW
ncbi:MAG: ketoacyl-ACP synthase III [Alphaproteobacteria bacterium]|nr:ketoacyl-ACP synthase III [Alphaproteobacteria bacterium]MBN9569189.1 ketoacyl-ACP synthase III [Alphaproteobacteria bacterium]MBN9576759.1 ketoacyl-ACP synthase III [Alphaproteobacteria bacterium]